MGEGRNLRVLVADAEQLFGEALCAALSRLPEVAECAVEQTAKRGLEQLDITEPDVVVLDAEISGPSSLDVATEVRRRWPEVRIVVVSGRADLDLLADAAALGVDGFLTKDVSLDLLCAAVLGQEPADLGQSSVLMMAAEAIRRREVARDATPVIDLTPREREVLAMLAQGVAMKDMAGLLGIRLETCRGYVKTLLAKLGARSQLQGVVFAARAGLLDDVPGLDDRDG